MNALVPSKSKSLSRQGHVDRIANRAMFTGAAGTGAVATIAADMVVPGIPVIDGIISLAQLITIVGTGGGALATVRAYLGWKHRHRR